jgi:hypothetical protein
MNKISNFYANIQRCAKLEGCSSLAQLLLVYMVSGKNNSGSMRGSFLEYAVRKKTPIHIASLLMTKITFNSYY